MQKLEFCLLYLRGFGITKNVSGLEPCCDVSYRLIVQSPKNVKSEPSDEVGAKTDS